MLIQSECQLPFYSTYSFYFYFLSFQLFFPMSTFFNFQCLDILATEPIDQLPPTDTSILNCNWQDDWLGVAWVGGLDTRCSFLLDYSRCWWHSRCVCLHHESSTLTTVHVPLSRTYQLQLFVRPIQGDGLFGIAKYCFLLASSS